MKYLQSYAERHQKHSQHVGNKAHKQKFWNKKKRDVTRGAAGHVFRIWYKQTTLLSNHCVLIILAKIRMDDGNRLNILYKQKTNTKFTNPSVRKFHDNLWTNRHQIIKSMQTRLLVQPFYIRPEIIQLTHVDLKTKHVPLRKKKNYHGFPQLVSCPTLNLFASVFCGQFRLLYRNEKSSVETLSASHLSKIRNPNVETDDLAVDAGCAEVIFVNKKSILCIRCHFRVPNDGTIPSEELTNWLTQQL